MQVLWRGMVQMKKFEYKRMYREVSDRELAMIGEAGWELVAVEPAKSDIPPTLWFKREKESYISKKELNGKISRRDS